MKLLPQQVPRGGLLGLPTPRPTSIGARLGLERLEKTRRSWGGSGEERVEGSVRAKEAKG